MKVMPIIHRRELEAESGRRPTLPTLTHPGKANVQYNIIFDHPILIPGTSLSKVSVKIVI